MRRYNGLVWVLLLLAGFSMLWVIGNERLRTQTQKTYEWYSDFVTDLQAGRLATVTLVGGQRAVGDFTTPTPEGMQTYVVAVPAEEGLAEKLRGMSPTARIRVAPATFMDELPRLLISILPFILIFGVLLWFMSRQMRASGSQAFDFGRSQARLAGENFPKVTFADVAGMIEVKQELEEVVEFLREPERFRAMGAKIPRGVLLVGPPGCGKTLLARAIAGEAGVAFFFLSGSDFVEMFVGVGASRVRDLFTQAKQHLPAIIFIDELDAVGRLRGAGLGGGHDEREQTLNALLVEMDGFDPNSDIVILAATNRPDILDPALLRPGRFDRHVVVPNPDVIERRAILELYTHEKPVGPDVDVESLARRTPGFSGADLESLMNEGALLAARRRLKQIGMPELDEAVERVMAGPQRRSRVLTDKERRIVAYHEAGHALVGSLLPGFDPTYKVTILPRGMAMGYTINLPEEDRYLSSRSELINRMTQALGGRVTEELIFGDVTTGASNDLEKVSEIAREMVTEFGMSEKMGPMTYGRKHGPVFLGKEFAEERNYSEQAAQEIDAEVRDLIEGCYQQARRLITEHRDRLELLAEALIERETLSQEEIASVVQEGVLPPVKVPVAPPAPAAAESRPPGVVGEAWSRPANLPPPLPETP